MGLRSFKLSVLVLGRRSIKLRLDCLVTTVRLGAQAFAGSGSNVQMFRVCHAQGLPFVPTKVLIHWFRFPGA